jgi:hypothetical protein
VVRQSREMMRARARWAARARRPALGTLPEISIPDVFAIRERYQASQQVQWVLDHWQVLALAGVAGVAFLGWLVLPWVGAATRHIDFKR